MELTWQSIVWSAIVLLGSYFFLRRNPRIKRHLDLLGGPKGYPIIGITQHFLRPHNEYIGIIDKFVEEYGTIFGAWIGNFLAYVFIMDPPTIEKVLSTTTHIDKGKYEYSLLHDWLGTGLLTAPRSKWSTRRKLLTPSFHFKILEDFVPVFNEQASVFLNCLEKEANTGKSFDIYPYITRCTLDVICETAMGKKINAQTSTSNKRYVDAVNGMCSVVLDKTLKPWLRVPLVYHLSNISKQEKSYLSTLKDFSEKVIQAKRLERKQSPERKTVSEGDVYGKQRKAFLDLLLDTSENGEVLTDADIREEVDTFMFEGHDTTGVNLGWTILLLASHLECQRKVLDEIDEIFSDDPERDVTTADVTKMKYLECCVKESLRLYPSVPFIMRQTDSDIALDDGRVIPKGATAMIGIYHVHRNPNYFSEPEKFNPERFTLDNSLKRHPFSYIAFSAGPRNCIGQKFALLEEKIVLAKLFQKYRLETENNELTNARPVPDVVLRCENGIHVLLHKRR